MFDIWTRVKVPAQAHSGGVRPVVVERHSFTHRTSCLFHPPPCRCRDGTGWNSPSPHWQSHCTPRLTHDKIIMDGVKNGRIETTFPIKSKIYPINISVGESACWSLTLLRTTLWAWLYLLSSKTRVTSKKSKDNNSNHSTTVFPDHY